MAKRSQKTRYYARRPMKYAGVQYARGQILKDGLVGARNDAKLLDLGYIAEVESGAETYTHADTGAEFISIATRTAYGDRLHREQSIRRNLNPDRAESEIEEMQEAEQQEADEIAPVTVQ